MTTVWRRGLPRAQIGRLVDRVEVASHPCKEKMDVGFGVQVTRVKCSVSARRFHGASGCCWGSLSDRECYICWCALAALPHILTSRFESSRKAMIRLPFFTRPKSSTKNERGSIEIRARRLDCQNMSCSPLIPIRCLRL